MIGNIRAALVTAAVIPLSMLISFIGMRFFGISANLMSLGAIAFGMIVDGAVVMVENILRHIESRLDPHRSLVQVVGDAAHEVQRPVFYAITIIITAYLPIFTLQEVEGRLFSPMAWTVSFALVGALIFSMLLAPVLCSYFFRKNVKEWHNPVLVLLTRGYRHALRWSLRHRFLTLSIPAILLGITIYSVVSGKVGSEFLPHLDEGAIWARGTLAPSTGPAEGERVMRQAVQQVVERESPEPPVSQTRSHGQPLLGPAARVLSGSPAVRRAASNFCRSSR